MKTLNALCLAALATVAGAASAQSNVTVYGKLDLGVGRKIDSTDKTLLDAAGSRLGFKGTEDLGGGLAALFQIEHRLDPASGAPTSSSTFWNGLSIVGLKTGFGTLTLGRNYTPAYALVQNQIDPFGGDTVAALRDAGMRPGGLYATRSASMLRYDFSANGLAFGASVSGSNENKVAKKPVAVAASYTTGALMVGAAYEITGAQAAADGKQWNLGASYNLGVATLAAGYSRGTSAANIDYTAWLLGATVPLAGGDLKLGYARQTKEGAGEVNSKLGLGYHYPLSKRTKLYADLGRDAKATSSNKVGYDLGVQHNF